MIFFRPRCGNYFFCFEFFAICVSGVGNGRPGTNRYHFLFFLLPLVVKRLELYLFSGGVLHDDQYNLHLCKTMCRRRGTESTRGVGSVRRLLIRSVVWRENSVFLLLKGQQKGNNKSLKKNVMQFDAFSMLCAI